MLLSFLGEKNHLRLSIFIEAIQAKLGTLSLEAQSKLEKDTAKKEAKAEAKADAAQKKKLVRSRYPFIPHASVNYGKFAGITSKRKFRYLCISNAEHSVLGYYKTSRTQ
jgi:hypothetical protein